jgi:hypothetical protein
MLYVRITTFFLITFILLSFFSCKPKKTSGSAEQVSGVVETTEMPVIDENPRGAVNTAHINETLALAMERQEDYAQALNYWTLASKYPFSEDYIENIAYGNGIFVATGHISINLAYSDDGDKWTAVGNIFGNSSVEAIVYGDGRFVAAAYGDKIAYSDDGMNWTLSNGGIGDCHTEGIAYGNGIFVVVGSKRSGGDGIIAYSSDGETWTITEDGGLGIGYFSCIAYGDGQFIAGAGEGKAAYSSDGKTWTAMPGSPFEDRDIRIITYGNGRFVAFVSRFQGYEPLLAYSDDGVDWTIISNDVTESFGFYNIVYANGIFIGVYHSARMVYSFDGETWYPDEKGYVIGAMDGAGANLKGIAYGNGRFVIGGGNGTSGSSKIAWCKMPDIVNENSNE